MSTTIEYTNIFISILEHAEYDCGTPYDELQQLNLEDELARLHDDCPSQYEAICHA